MQDMINMENAFGKADDGFQKTVHHTLAKLKKDEDSGAFDPVIGSNQRVLRYPMKRIAVIAAAIILALTLATTGIAYGGEIIDAIKSFMFGNSSATQVEYIENKTVSLRIVNRSELVDHDKGTGLIHFDSVEEANQCVPFTIKVPSYLPDNVIGFSHPVIVQRKLDGTAGYDVFIQYRVDDPSNIDELNLINIDQYYIGPNAHVEIETIVPIQKVMVGDIEASLVFTEGYFDYVQYYLYWIKDDILYEFINGCFDLETMLAIAESVE